MFDDPLADAKYRARRPVVPPARVSVSLGLLWPPRPRDRGAAGVPLWLRAKGLRVGDVVSGVLLEWVRTAEGEWLGRCRFTVMVDGGPLELDQLAPAKALQLLDRRD